MKYEFHPADPAHYATDLRVENGSLRWACGRGQTVLLVQTPCGEVPKMESLCREMTGAAERDPGFSALVHQRFVVLSAAVRLVSAAERARQNGCPLNGEACAYTVFPCVEEEDRCRVFPSGDGAVSSSRCEVPLRMSVAVIPLAKRGGLPWRRETARYYRISFPGGRPPSYADGDLAYTADGFTVPVTGRMLEAGTFYVHSDAPPTLSVRRPGLELV